MRGIKGLMQGNRSDSVHLDPQQQHAVSFRVRKRNRALSDVDFDQLLTQSRGWAFDPSCSSSANMIEREDCYVVHANFRLSLDRKQTKEHFCHVNVDYLSIMNADVREAFCGRNDLQSN